MTATTAQLEALAALRPGDHVELDRDALGLSPTAYGPRVGCYVTHIGGRGAVHVETCYRTPTSPARTFTAQAAAIVRPHRLAERNAPDAYRTPRALELAAAAEPELEARPVIVVPCGARKVDHRAPAGELYTGPLHRSARLAADRLADELDAEVLILSAKFGLVDLDLELDPYNVTVGDAGAIGPIELAAQVAARNLYSRRTIVLGGSAYAELLEAAGVHQLERPLDGCAGLGYMRGRLAAIARTGLLDPSDELGPAGRHAEQLTLELAA